jgi:peptidoglycan/xylan/chitin deacetylase (PgdA/CDA1 family)
MIPIKDIIQRTLLALRDLVAPLFRSVEVSILCYHSIGQDGNSTTITPEQFERHLALLQEHSVQFVPLEKIVGWVQHGGVLPRRVAAITFDDGYADMETTALPILEKVRAPATVFIIGDEAGARTYLGSDIPLLSSEALERLRTHPLIDIGYHSATHPDLSKLEPQALREEVARPAGNRYFAYPGGNHSPQVAEAVREAGYDAAVTIGWDLVQKDTDPYLLPRSVIVRDMPLWRVRMATTRALVWYRRGVRFIKA